MFDDQLEDAVSPRVRRRPLATAIGSGGYPKRRDADTDPARTAIHAMPRARRL